MKRVVIYLELIKGDIKKVEKFVSFIDEMVDNVNYWKWFHKQSGWRVRYLGYKYFKEI